jgi:hypothetical protein
MTVHLVTEGQGFWNALNPFKTSVTTLCGQEIDTTTTEESTGVQPTCGECNKRNAPLF